MKISKLQKKIGQFTLQKMIVWDSLEAMAAEKQLFPS